MPVAGLTSILLGYQGRSPCLVRQDYKECRKKRSINENYDGRISHIRSNILPFSRGTERDEAGYYVATVPTLLGCRTQAKSLDTLLKVFGK
jgi:hypothetical protein